MQDRTTDQPAPNSITVPTDDPDRARLIDLGQRAQQLLDCAVPADTIAHVLKASEETVDRALTVYRLWIDPDYVLREWATELHPAWCGAKEANGCGSHYSDLVDVAATADERIGELPEGEAYPFASVAAVMFVEDNRRAVSLQVDSSGHGPRGYSTTDVLFTPDEARQLAAALVSMAYVAESETQMSTRPLVRPATQEALILRPCSGSDPGA